MTDAQRTAIALCLSCERGSVDAAALFADRDLRFVLDVLGAAIHIALQSTEFISEQFPRMGSVEQLLERFALEHGGADV